MAPTQEAAPVRYFHIQLRPSHTGQWAPEIAVQADVVCEQFKHDDGRLLHLFKRGTVIVAQYESDLVAGWRVEEREQS